MTHRNAPLTPTGRARLVSLVIDHGWSQRRAAERCQVSAATAHRWVARHRAGEPLADRTSRPHHCPHVCGQLFGGGRDTRFQQRGQLFFRTSDTPPHRPPLHHRRRPHNNTDHTGRHTPTTPA